MTLPILNAALQIRKTRGFSFWDSAIVAAALASAATGSTPKTWPMGKW